MTYNDRSSGMAHIIIALDGDTFIHRNSTKTTDEICREIELGAFDLPVQFTDPVTVRLRDYLLVAEREAAPLLSRNQINVMELLSLGASETEIARSLALSYSGVRHHVESLKKKFNVATREELIAIYSRLFRG